MKDSAWYHKLWRKKLDKYPLKEGTAGAWSEMNDLLNRHMPVNNAPAGNKPGKFFGSTVVSMLGFILPAAAMIGALSYVAIKHPFAKKEVNKHHYNTVLKRPEGVGVSDSLTNAADTPKADTAVRAVKGNLTAADSTQKRKIIKAGPPITANIALTATSAKSNLKTAKYSKLNFTGHKPVPTTVSASPNKLNAQMPVINQNKGALVAGAANDKTGRDSVKYYKNDAVNNSTGAKNGSNAFAIPDKATRLKLAAANGKAGGKSKSPDVNKIKTPRSVINGSSINYSIVSALNISKSGSNVVFGVGAGCPLNSKWMLNADIQVDLKRSLSDQYTHRSYNRSDTLFSVTDSRKLNTVLVPVTLEYKISDRISVNAGPQLSFSASQSNLKSGVGIVPDYRDTLSHTHTIDSALRNNHINKINIGVTGGVSIKLNQFFIDATLQQNLTPYNVTTGLGGYKQYYRSIQIGIRYKFKKGR